MPNNILMVRNDIFTYKERLNACWKHSTPFAPFVDACQTCRVSLMKPTHITCMDIHKICRTLA